MPITITRAVAGLATATIVFSAVDPAAAFGPRIGGMTGLHAGLGAFHGAPAGRFQMGQRLRMGSEFRMGDHAGRFHHEHFSPFLGLFAPYGYLPSDDYASYGNSPFYGLGYGYNITVTTTSSTGTPSAYAGESASGGSCALYKLRYDYRGRYQGVRSFHPCL